MSIDASAPPAPGGEPILRLRGLGKTYGSGDTAVHALRDVDLDVRAGEFIVLLGASGSGKSTLLNILGGLDRPSHGQASFMGHRLDDASDDDLTRYRREHVGFVFQFYNLIPSLTVRENVLLVTDIASDPMPADEALALVALTPRRDHFPSQLSGGEQQRVAIARAIVKRPQLLLCDEPTGALDYATGKLVLEVIARINRELGTTAVVITHNAAIAGMADRVIRLADGRVASIDVPERRLTPAQLSW
ncbi:MAG: ABC transporter ATP-binding protein [Proteobacteria bacterium]|jgi:putative ABC transport system ATP-binding protein|nr:ABC transporter ATP-binding protein [Ramlibacter sp.]MCA0213992.1 ABC transporter ATP-binding protein [Pseudomonadota bacterium]